MVNGQSRSLMVDPAGENAVRAKRRAILLLLLGQELVGVRGGRRKRRKRQITISSVYHLYILNDNINMNIRNVELLLKDAKVVELSSSCEEKWPSQST